MITKFFCPIQGSYYKIIDYDLHYKNERILLNDNIKYKVPT